MPNNHIAVIESEPQHREENPLFSNSLDLSAPQHSENLKHNQDSDGLSKMIINGSAIKGDKIVIQALLDKQKKMQMDMYNDQNRLQKLEMQV